MRLRVVANGGCGLLQQQNHLILLRCSRIFLDAATPLSRCGTLADPSSGYRHKRDTAKTLRVVSTVFLRRLNRTSLKPIKQPVNFLLRGKMRVKTGKKSIMGCLAAGYTTALPG
jgi:hypothetical protein